MHVWATSLMVSMSLRFFRDEAFNSGLLASG